MKKNYENKSEIEMYKSCESGMMMINIFIKNEKERNSNSLNVNTVGFEEKERVR